MDTPRHHGPLTARQSSGFDNLVEEIISTLPPALAELVDSVAIIVLDRPEPHMLRDLGIDPADTAAILEICGMHSGTPDTESSLEDSGALPPQIHLFREGIISLCDGFDPSNPDSLANVREEILVTLLHEIGHQFGLDEDDLEELGYQ
jgi:predicted Zn-dependent protease with MMP-like domain